MSTLKQEHTPELMPPPHRGPHNSLWLLACLLLALVQVRWAGYQLGVGNQSIQVAFLQRLHDAALFPRDVMVNLTLDRYPSLFFRALAHVVGLVEFEHLYLALHLLATLGVFVAVAALARVMFRSHWAGLVAGLFLLAGHHHALAGEVLYSNGFTHTWAVFPLLLMALGLWYADWHYAAFALTGALCNAHALEAGQLGLVLVFWALASGRRLGWRKVGGLLAVLALFALPAIVLLLRRHPSFDPLWLQLTRLRSGLHSFPSTWWRPGNADVPRFALAVALGALALSLAPTGAPLRKTLLLTAAAGAMFVVGTVFTEAWPNATVVRAQLFRSSRFVLVVALVTIAWGCWQAWTLPWAGGGDGRRWRGGLEFLSAALTALALIVPPAIVLLPVALAVATLVALINRRLLWQQAALAGAAALICLVAWRQIQFVVPGLSPEFSWRSAFSSSGPGMTGWLVLTAVAALWFLAQQSLSRGQAELVAAVAAGSGVALAVTLGPALLRPPASDAAWCDVQRWAQAHTPVDALFLTPAQESGFRMLSQRSVVGEWRDGTQLYFSADFTKPWWERMNALQPGMRLAPDGQRLLVRGKSLGQLEDEPLIALARQFGATHVVVPAEETRRLMMLYTNAVWGVYRPQIAPPAVQQSSLLARQAAFLREVALPNIEKHRKSDVRLQIVAADGRPLYDAQYRVTQTASAFGFGVSLPPRGADPDTNRLARVRDLFNFTVIRDPAWWATIEPEPGQRQSADLEATLAWCHEQGVASEVSSLGGVPPAWLRSWPVTNQVTRLVEHAQDLVGRYGERVTYWQVTDCGVLLAGASNVIVRLREQYPQSKLGLSDAGRFWSPFEGAVRDADLERGLEDARRLREQGAPVDFVALRGHQPWGVWADVNTIYAVLDEFARESLPVHITEFAVPSAGTIEGSVRRGSWDAKLQADYCRLFYTVCYSHPSVAAINYLELGPGTRVPDAGLFGADGRPKPALAALRDLITKQWRTRLTGTLPLDGRLAFRGFQGDYELTVTLKGGQMARAVFAVAPGRANDLRFELAAATGKLTLVK